MSSNDTVIVAQDAGRSSVSIPSDHIYWTFASGRLGYDCISCGAKCCRGLGYGVHGAGELDSHLRARPSIRFFIEPPKIQNDGLFQVRNYQPACFFLNENGLCHLHVDYGYEAKPEVCRLFPFNNLRLASGYLIVAPSHLLCPLEVRPPHKESAASRHEHLLSEFTRQRIATTPLQVVAVQKDVSKLINLERAIVGLSETHLTSASYGSFAEMQLSLTQDILGSHDSGEAPETAIEHHRQMLCRVLKVAEVSDLEPVFAQTMIGMTPYMRSLLLFNPSSHLI